MPAEHEKNNDRAASSVFIVDPDDALTRRLSDLLSAIGAQVRVFPSVAPALAAATSPPACVISEVRLPDMSGIELIDALRNPGVHSPVILLAAESDVATAVKAMRAGALDFIEKPFNDEALLDSIRRALALAVEQRRLQARQAEIATRLALLTPREHEVMEMVGEVHHRPRYWEFNSALARAPEFCKAVGVIYMELPSNDQALVEQFLAAPKYDSMPVIEMLRDMLWMGWPDQPMLDFFKTVWEVNQKLPAEQRLRIVLVDMRRPWKEVKSRGDWRKYDVDRNQLMAEIIVRDLGEHQADARHALFIVGYMHAMVNHLASWR